MAFSFHRQENLPSTPSQVRGSQVPMTFRHYIRLWYPDLVKRTYFLPYVYMHRVMHEPVTMPSGLLVSVPQAPAQTQPQAASTSQKAKTKKKTKGQSGKQSKTYLFLETDVRDVNAQQHVTFCLRALAEKQEEVMFVISQLDFGDYLGQPSYAPAAASQKLPPRPRDLKPQNLDEGDFDVVIIHIKYGLCALEIKSVGVSAIRRGLTEQQMQDELLHMLSKMLRLSGSRKRKSGSQPAVCQKQSHGQLERTTLVLAHIVSDLKPPPRVQTLLVLPYISSTTLRSVLGENCDVKQALISDLGLPSTADPVDYCLCGDQMSKQQKPHDVNDNVLASLGSWWSRCVAGRGVDSAMTPDLYEELVARFAGPATVVKIHCRTEPRLEVTDLRMVGQFVSEAGERLTALALFPYQVDLINKAPDLAFLAGPPGTGKTLTLVVMALEWLRHQPTSHPHRPSSSSKYPSRQQNQSRPQTPSTQLSGGRSGARVAKQMSPVHIVSASEWSRAVSHHIMQQLLVTAQQTLGSQDANRIHIHLLNWEYKMGGDLTAEVEKLVTTLVSSTSNGVVNIIADEMQDINEGLDLLYQGLTCHSSISKVRLWAASIRPFVAPKCLQQHVCTFSHPLRSPPIVTREIAQSVSIKSGRVPQYTQSPAPAPCDGPPVLYVTHDGAGHTDKGSEECEKCGEEVGKLLREDLRVGKDDKKSSCPPLRYRDVFVLSSLYLHDDEKDEEDRVTKPASGFVRGVRQAGLPVRVVEADDVQGLEDLGTMSGPDAVAVTGFLNVYGLERKVVVWLEELKESHFDRLISLSRATSQVVWVKPSA